MALHARDIPGLKLPASAAAPKAAGSKAALQALGRLPAGTMNKTETAYDAHLAGRQHAGEILWRKFEGIKLRLADNTFLTVDFAVMLANGQMQMHEVKGFMEEDANVKLKVAASMYPFQFYVVRVQAKKLGGGWSVEAF